MVQLLAALVVDELDDPSSGREKVAKVVAGIIVEFDHFIELFV